MTQDVTLMRTIPACESEDGASSASAAICEQTVRSAVARYGPDLRGIVLTGSLARDEGTFVRQGTCWKLLGDADFFFVFHERARLPAPSTFESCSREISEILEAQGVIAAIGLAIEYGSYFERLPPHISTYELRACGRIIWGDSGILALIPAFASSEILLEDAWRMLGNRMIELLEAIAAAPSKGQYCAIKLYLDIATSYLVFIGHYFPTYREREKTVRDLANDVVAQTEAPFSLSSFADRLAECTRFKLDGRATANSVEFFEDAIRFARLLWRWELQRLTGEANELSDAELISEWMRRQPLKARVRGWLSVFRRYGGFRSLSQWARWSRLSWQASPRYWVYHVAAEVFFHLPALLRKEHELAVDLKRLTSRLPLHKDPELEPAMAGWSALSQLIALNYHRLLETTSA